ncbi:DUF4236 domain-containing protein [Psychrobacillus sp. NPDC058041]|uniref:DUF4236 domain-containing protein n=1 Tax=Psychrobacillus sp. NPDC058041 TaxID=3346310 RepID=UPI0036DACB98
MGLRVRKSFKIAKGVRVNLSKSGVGVSVGTRGLRHSIHSSGRRTSTIGIPGSGISYVKTSSTARKNRVVSNNAIQKKLEKQLEIEKNSKIVDEYNVLLERIISVHKTCDDFVDWKSINAIHPPFEPPNTGPHQTIAQNKYNSFKPNILEKLFKNWGEKRRNKLRMEIHVAKEKDKKEYDDWKSLHLLSERVINGDVDAYFEVVNEMNPFDDLLEFGSDFEFSANNSNIIEVEFKVKSDSVVPNYSLSLTQTGKLSQKNMTKTTYYDIVQDYVCSCSIRVARDLMALLPAEQVIIHAVDEVLNTSTGYKEEITILSVSYDRKGLDALNFELIDPSDAMQNFKFNMKHMKTTGFKAVERVIED